MSNDTGSTGVKRRDFLKVLGATGAAVDARSAARSEKVGKLIPYLVHPDQTVSGRLDLLRHHLPRVRGRCGVIAETRDGRVIKLEGNPSIRSTAAHSARADSRRCRGSTIPTASAARWCRRTARWKRDRPGTRRSHARQPEARRGAEPRHDGQRRLHQPARAGQLPRASSTRGSRGFGMRPHLSVRLRGDGAVDRGEPAGVRRRVAELSTSPTRSSSSPSAPTSSTTWGMSVPQQLDFADARAKIEGAPRFVYVGPRRSLTGLNADQWIACKPGTELAIANALAGTRLHRRCRAAVRRCRRRRSSALQQELAAAASRRMVLAGGTDANALELATRRRRASTRHGGAVGTTIRPARRSARSTARRLRAICAPPSSACARARCRVVFVRGANPAYTPARVARLRRRVREGAVQGQLLELPGRDDRAVRPRPPRPPLRSSRGATRRPVPGSSSLQQPAMDPVFDTRATADVLIAARAEGPDQTTAARYPHARLPRRG